MTLYARSARVQFKLSVHAINEAPQFWSYRVAKKQGPNVGGVAVAWAMLKTIDAMLMKQEVFQSGKGITGHRCRVMVG